MFGYLPLRLSTQQTILSLKRHRLQNIILALSVSHLVFRQSAAKAIRRLDSEVKIKHTRTSSLRYMTKSGGVIRVIRPHAGVGMKNYTLFDVERAGGEWQLRPSDGAIWMFTRCVFKMFRVCGSELRRP